MLRDHVVYQSLKDLVVRQIRRSILNGDLELGTRLVETTVASELGVSRGPVREAFVDLAREGLLSITPRRGASVSTLPPEDVWQLYALRAHMETLIIRHGLKRLTPADLDELQDLVDQMGELTDGPGAIARATELDMNFHARIADSCPYRRITEAYRALDGQVGAGIYTVIKVLEGTVRRMQAKHASVLDAIRTRDSAFVEQVLHAHWMDTAELMRSAVHYRSIAEH